MAPGPGPIFFPKYLDLTEDECARFLRQLELEAYAAVISALRAQGDLSKEKKALLAEICACFGIGEDRYKAEIRRAVNDEKLSTIALHISNNESSIEWIKEGRRLIPLPNRPLEITAYMEEADRVAEIIAKENAALPESTVGFRSFTKKQNQETVPPKQPVEVELQNSTRILRSSLYCAKCLSTQSDTADVSTSTDEFTQLSNSNIGRSTSPDITDVPSASDSYVFLPGGTTIRVATGKQEKEEQVDAYSMKSNSSGQIDFGNAPEISLTAPRATKRKRKKSVGTAPSKDSSVTIRQVIRPLSTKQETSPEKIVLNTQVENLDFDDKLPDFPEMRLKPEIIPRPAKQPSKRKQAQQQQQVQEYDRRYDEPYTKRRKRAPVVKEPPPPPPPTIQHTPVPPEHLYAAGSNTNRLKQQRKLQQAAEEEILVQSRARPEYSVSTQQSPTKHIGQFTSRMSPLSPSYYPPPGQSQWSSSTSSIVPRDITTNPETITTYSRGFRFSPTKPFYKPPNIVQNTYGRPPKSSSQPGKKYKQHSPSTFSFSKKAMQAEIEHQSILKRIAARKDIGRASGQHRDPNLPFRSTEDQNAFVLPVLESTKYDDQQQHQQQPAPHSSSLEELASVSLMASALSTSSIVETGLAPVSAIVSRVSSPAPGQLSTTDAAAAMKKSTAKPMIISRVQTEEGESSQSVKIVHPTSGGQILGTSPSIAGRPGFVNVLREAATTLTPSGIRLKNAGSIVSISGQHPATHQVRLAVSTPDNTISSVPINFTSAVPPVVSSPLIQTPRVISSVTGKPHTVLKSSSGNVITVTAKPLPGIKSSPSTMVSGASIVKPQLVQKTSIIVVHKPGSKIGKTTPAGFPLGAEGSKVITVSTKNLSTSTVDLPRSPAESEDDNSTSTSALGSIQGLVSGLNPTGIVKKTKVIGAKPKFVTMPLHHKKTVVGKITDTSRTKVIQNVIRAPGKVLVRTTSGSTLSTALRTFTGSRIVKPIITQQQPGVAQITAGHGPPVPAAVGTDIVAAALSQSLGASTVLPTLETTVVPITKPEGSPSPGIIKVSTSTPAASTIKAFAANYQKTSTSQQKQMKPLPLVTTVSPSIPEKTKVYLATSPGQPKTQLFTPNQPQVHRSPQGPSASIPPRPKSGFIQPLKTPSVPYMTPVSSVPKSSPKVQQTKTIYQQHQSQPVMQVRVIGNQESNVSSAASQQWQSPAVISGSIQSIGKEVDESVTQTKILRDIFESTGRSESDIQSQQQQSTASDRATYIYQYHANPTLQVSHQEPSSQIEASCSDSRNMITLHSVASCTEVVEASPVVSTPMVADQRSVVVVPSTAAGVSFVEQKNTNETGIFEKQDAEFKTSQNEEREQNK